MKPLPLFAACATVALLASFPLSAQAQNLFRAKINFQPSSSTVPAGYLADNGAVFGSRGNGYSYGWNANNSANTRDRNATADQRYDTLIRTQNGGNFTWEIAVPRGIYTVRLVAGDPSFIDSEYAFDVEGVLALSDTPTAQNLWGEGFQTVRVDDGRLTVSNTTVGGAGVNNKLCFVEIVQHWGANVNFQPAGKPVPAGYIADTGAVYGSRGNGYTYGWNLNNAANTRDRNLLSDQRYDTLAHTQLGGNFSWKIALPSPGFYSGRVVAGDPGFSDSVYSFKLNNGYLLGDTVPTAAAPFAQETFGGEITLSTATITNGTNAVNNKLAFFEIYNQAAGPFDPIFEDQFNGSGSTLGSDWATSAFSPWTKSNGAAFNTERGGGAFIETAQYFPHENYEIETRAQGLGRTQGPSQSDYVSVVFGAQDTSSWNFYRLRYHWGDPLLGSNDSRYFLERVQVPAGGGELITDILATVTAPPVPDTGWVKWKIQHNDLGFIRFFVDSGNGYAATPLIQVRDTTPGQRPLGHFGWMLVSEAPAPFSVDWITARHWSESF